MRFAWRDLFRCAALERCQHQVSLGQVLVAGHEQESAAVGQKAWVAVTVLAAGGVEYRHRTSRAASRRHLEQRSGRRREQDDARLIPGSTLAIRNISE
jgi:hypothetical protein